MLACNTIKRFTQQIESTIRIDIKQTIERVTSKANNRATKMVVVYSILDLDTETKCILKLR